MEYTVYADVLFLVNWLMDYLLLRAVAAVLNFRPERKRLAAAAAVGGIWVCLISIWRLPRLLEGVLSLAGISSFMVWLAFHPESFRGFIRQLAVLYGSAVLGGGIVNLIYFHTAAGYYLKLLVRGRMPAEAASVMAVFASAAATAVSVWAIKRFLRFRQRQSSLFTVTLFLEGDQVRLKALLDTGNRLRAPVSGKPVHIAAMSAVRPLRPEREDAVKLLIPYHAIGTRQGFLTAMRIDRMELTGENCLSMIIEQPLIGLYEGELSHSGEYQMILHSDTMTRQGEKL